MPLVEPHHLAAAITQIKSMSLAEKEAEFDVIYHEQPNLLASVLVQQQMGNSLEQMEVLLNLLLTIHLSLREAGIVIQPVSEKIQEQQLRRFIGRVNFVEDLREPQRSNALEEQLNDFPEKWLYSYALNEMKNAGFPELEYESSKYLTLCGLNLVNCVNPVD